jgi:hypothetical protein
MSLESTFADLLCQTYARRGSRKIEKGIDEWAWAEAGAYFQFEKDFKARHGGGIVLGQLTYKNLGTPTDPDTQFIIEALKVYFRNWWSPANVSREGGFRKPDGLGISPGGRVIEIIEVKPYHSAKEGTTQLNEMITKIKDGLNGYYQEECTRTATSVGPDPANYVTVKGSPWRPSGVGLVIPLLPDPRTEEVSWVCYRPTLRADAAEGAPPDGVILYEIHFIDKKRIQQQIPQDVAERIAEAHARRRQAAEWNPFATNYVRQNPKDAALMRDLALTLGVAAAVAIVVVAVIYAAPLVVGGAAAASGTAATAGLGSVRCSWVLT